MQPPTDDVCPDWPSNVKDVATPESWAWVVLRSQSDDHCNQECEPPPSKPGDLNIYRRRSSTLTGQTLFEPQRFRCFSPYSCVTLTFPAEIPRRSRTDRPTWQAQWASTSVTSPLLTEGAIKQYASAFSLLGGGSAVAPRRVPLQGPLITRGETAHRDGPFGKILRGGGLDPGEEARES